MADFIGHANIVKLEIASLSQESITAKIPGGTSFTAKALKPDVYSATEVLYHVGKSAALIVRPESIQVGAAQEGEGIFPATVVSSIFVGSHIEYELLLKNNATIHASVPFSTGMEIYGEEASVSLTFDEQNSAFLPA